MSQDETAKIVVIIQGGAVADVQFPPGCTNSVLIRDYDTDGVDEAVLGEDEEGDRCQEFEFSPSDTPEEMS